MGTNPKDDIKKAYDESRKPLIFMNLDGGAEGNRTPDLLNAIRNLIFPVVFVWFIMLCFTRKYGEWTFVLIGVVLGCFSLLR